MSFGLQVLPAIFRIPSMLPLLPARSSIAARNPDEVFDKPAR